MFKIKERIVKTWLGSLMIMLIASALTGNKAATQRNFEYASDVVAQKVHNAFLGIVITSVMALVVGSVFLYIGLFVNVTVYNAIPTASLTEADNTTLLGIKTNVNTAFTLGGIIMIVIGAAGIISVLLGMVPSQRVG